MFDKFKFGHYLVLTKKIKFKCQLNYSCWFFITEDCMEVKNKIRSPICDILIIKTTLQLRFVIILGSVYSLSNNLKIFIF